MQKKCQIFIHICFIVFIIPFYVDANLKIENIYPKMGQLASPIAVNLFGEDFDNSTRVSMISDIANKRFIVGTENSRAAANLVLVFGNFAFVECGDNNAQHGIQIIDISTPKNPKEIGFIEVESPVKAMAIIGHDLYCAYNRNDSVYINIYDIQVPVYPQPVDPITVSTNYNVEDIGFWNNNIVVLLSNHIQIVPLQNSTESRTITFSETGMEYASSLHIDQDFVYIAEITNGMLYCISLDENNPSRESIQIAKGQLNDIVIQDNHAYLTNREGLEVINIKNMQPIASLKTPGTAIGLVVRNQTAFIADSESGVQVIDVSNPGAPELIGNIDTPKIALQLALFENFAIVADYESGIQVIDISTPEVSNLLASVDLNGDATGIQVMNNIAYVTTTYTEPGLTMIDINKRKNPVVLGKYPAKRAEDVLVDNHIAFVIDDNSRLLIIDVHDPEQPILKSIINDIAFDIRDVAIKNSVAYLATYSDKLIFIDISDLEKPFVKEQMMFREMGKILGITIDGNMAYLACTKGLQLVDITDSESPEQKGNEFHNLNNIDRENIKIQIYKDRAFIVHCKEFLVFDISNIWDPAIKKVLPLSDCGNDISIIDNMAYVAMGGSGIAMIDIQDKNYPKEIGIVDTPGNAMALEIMGNLALVADKSKGFIIVPLPVEIPKDYIQVNSSHKLTVNLPVDRIAQEGHYTVKVFNNYDKHELPGAFTFQDNLRTSKAIILASSKTSHPENDALWEPFKRVADNAYNTLVYQGIYRENIMYLRSDFCADCENLLIEEGADNLTGNFQESSKENLEKSIKEWASQTDDLFIYIVGHGLSNAFMVNSENNDLELLTPDDINQWLISYQKVMPDDGKMVIIYDACQSGSFINELTIPEAATANQKFIMITSASAFENAIFSDKGRDSFSYSFWNAIYDGDYLDDAFFYSQNKLTNFQTSMMDANGNHAGNEKTDRIQANNITIGRGYGHMPTHSPACKNVSSNLPDVYENDDTFHHANLIINFDKYGYSQCHTFHHAEDQDWSIFMGLSGTIYTIEINAAQSSCDPIIEIFDIDGKSLLAKKDNGIAGEPEYIDWLCHKDGLYYIKISNASHDFGNQNVYAVKIYEPYASFNGRLLGKIHDADTGKTIENVQVKLEGKYPYTGTYQMNEKHAQYRFSQIISGIYTLIAEARGYRLFSKVIDLGQLTEGSSYNFVMHPLSLRGDMNGDTIVDLKDMIIILQISTGFLVDTSFNCEDVCIETNGHFCVGLDEAIYVIKEIAD